MRYILAILFIMGISSISHKAFAGNCGGGDHFHTDQKMKEKKPGA